MTQACCEHTRSVDPARNHPASNQKQRRIGLLIMAKFMRAQVVITVMVLTALYLHTPEDSRDQTHLCEVGRCCHNVTTCIAHRHVLSICQGHRAWVAGSDRLTTQGLLWSMMLRVHWCVLHTQCGHEGEHALHVDYTRLPPRSSLVLVVDCARPIACTIFPPSCGQRHAAQSLQHNTRVSAPGDAAAVCVARGRP